MDKSNDDKPIVHVINPPPRRRGLPASPAAETAQLYADRIKQPARIPESSGARSQAKTKRKKRSPTGSYECGWCKPPMEHQFKAGNSGGPGRPKGRKSQDTLLRAALAQKRPVRVGGREKLVSNHELANTLLVNTTLEKRDPRQILALLVEAKRLFPEPSSEAAELDAVNPDTDREVLQQLFSQLALGEPDPDCLDPMRDAAIATPDISQGTADDGWAEGDWDPSDEEASDGKR